MKSLSIQRDLPDWLYRRKILSYNIFLFYVGRGATLNESNNYLSINDRLFNSAESFSRRKKSDRNTSYRMKYEARMYGADKFCALYELVVLDPRSWIDPAAGLIKRERGTSTSSFHSKPHHTPFLCKYDRSQHSMVPTIVSCFTTH